MEVFYGRSLQAFQKEVGNDCKALDGSVIKNKEVLIYIPVYSFLALQTVRGY